MNVDRPSYTDIDMPPGYVAVPNIDSYLHGRLDHPNPWGIKCSFDINKIYSPMPPWAGNDGSSIPLVSVNTAIMSQLLEVVENGLLKGKIEAFAVVPSHNTVISLPSSFWSIPQVSLASPLEPPLQPIKLAYADQPLVLLQHVSPRPLGVPILSTKSLCRYLNAERIPDALEVERIEWNDWLKFFVKYENSRAGSKSTWRKRGPRFDIDWTPMWHELVRQAARGNTDGWTISFAENWLAKWLSQQMTDPPETTTIRSRLEGLFPNGTEKPEALGAVTRRRKRSS